MQLLDIQNEVIQLTKEYTPGNPTFATLANVTTYANEGQKKIARRTRNRIKSNFPYWAGGQWNQNQYQQITFSTIPTAGTFTLTFNGQTTATLPNTTNSATLQTALQGLSTIGAGNCWVFGSFTVGFTVLFINGFIGHNNIPMMTSVSSLTDIMAIAVAVTLTGVTSGNQDAALYTIPNQRLYDLPTDWLQMIRVSVNNIPLKPSRFADFSGNIMWHRQPGFPLEYYFEKDSFSQAYKLGLFLRPTTAWPLGLTYIPIPTSMVGATDTPDIEDFLQPALTHYVCWRIFEYRREYAKAQYWKNQYDLDLQDYESSGEDTDEAIPFLQSPRPTD